MKKLSLVLMLVVFSIGMMFAQRSITGTITDDSGESLIGASILVKGTSTGTVTDIDGTYSLNVPDGNNTLVVSYTGYATQEVELGASNVVDIVLAESATQLTEVVVTGLGIRKEKKALGYGVTTVGDEQITGRQETDVARILRGKATGVDIQSTSGMAGTGTNVIIRGYSSITGDNQPLFVVDGIPFNTATNSDRNGLGGGATASSRFLDLDPNNIAEISILKGLSATVLYGEAGRNGVILVTTKNGSVGEETDKKFEVSVTQSLAQTEVANIPDYQNTFGNGFSGNFGWFFSNWGPAFDVRGSNGVSEDGQIDHPLDQAQYNAAFPEFIGADYPYQPHESVENFYQQGLVSNTSIAITNNLGNGSSVSATYSYLFDEGFAPRLDSSPNAFDGEGGASNFLAKHNFGLGIKTQLGNGIGVRSTFNYTDTERRTPPTGAGFGGDGDGLFAGLTFTPRSIDLINLPYQNPLDGSNVYYRRGSAIQNPLWTLNNVSDKEKVRRFFSTNELNYEFNDNFSVLYRLGIDQYAQRQRREYNRGGPRNPDGNLITSARLNRITDQVLNFIYQFQLTDDLALDGIVGVNLRREVADRTFTISSNQFVYGLFTHDNFITHQNFSFLTEENTIGAYLTATLAYKTFLYVNFQGRNDWTSTLEADNRSIFYPSGSISFVPTEAIPGLQNNKWVNYLKLRAGVGTSAGYPNPYQTRNVLDTETRQYVSGANVLNTNSVSDRLGNPLLAPELHTEIEAGIEARFINNRFGVDLSLYNKESRDLIIDLDLDPATGYRRTTVNAASITNQGVELALNFVPVKGDLTWDFTLNYTANEGTVNSISEGVDQVLIANSGDLFDRSPVLGGGLGNYAVPGQPYGVIQGTPYVRFDANGDGETTPDEPLLVNAIGEYISGPDIDVIGDPNPDFQANWINNISYKGLSFGFQWAYTQGGDIYSQTIAALLARGNTVDTDVDRFLPIILPGVDDDGNDNTVQTYIGDTFFSAYFGANEGAIFDGTNIRLREVSLAYTLPDKLLENTPFGRIGITFAGENLWYNAPNTPVGVNFDPEVLSLGVGNARGFDLRTGPTAKKYGFTLNATF